MATHDNPAYVNDVYVIVGKGADAYEVYTDETDAHKSITGDEHLFDVFRVPLKVPLKDSNAR